MKISLLAALIVTALLPLACSREERSERSSASYEVISEGSASGVTSTIGDVGEPLTGTNVDTTTAFTIVPPQPGLSPDTTGTSLASELPPSDGSLSRAPTAGVPSGSVTPSPSSSGTISITPSRPASRPAPAPARPSPPVTAPPPTTTAEPVEPEEPAEEAPQEQPEAAEEEDESAPTTTAPATSPDDGSGTASFLLS